MPTYAYHCSNCGAEFDMLQHYTDDPLTICPECGEACLRKVYEPTVFILHGDGWYKTNKAHAE